MERKSGDRRVRRTQRLLKESLLELMREKPFPDISVADIADRADVNRATFYLHYSNPANLLQSIGEDLLEELQTLFDDHQQELMDSENIRPILEPVLDFVISFQDLCTLLFAHEQESQFSENLLLLIQTNGTRVIKTIPMIQQDEEVTYLVSFLAHGVIGMIRTWVHRGMDLPKEKLLKAAEKMTAGAVSQYGV